MATTNASRNRKRYRERLAFERAAYTRVVLRNLNKENGGIVASTNASRLIALFGGVRATASATGLDIATVSRWTSTGRRGTRGKIPAKHNQVLMKAATKGGFPAQAYSCLTLVCPVCNGKWSP